jgi:hypothetical protein
VPSAVAAAGTVTAPVEDGTARRAQETRPARGIAAVVPRFGPGAEVAFERRAHACLARCGVVDPRAGFEGRPVAHVALVAAVEVRHPLAPSVEVETDDRSLHPSSL